VGRLGGEVTTEQGKEAARGVAIDLIGTLNAAVGDLNLIRRIVKLMALVNSSPSFTEQHLVANGASALLVQVFGDAGAHARAAFGVAQIPFGSCVEIQGESGIEGIHVGGHVTLIIEAVMTLDVS
jgi:enamine deaminase RidA (YjgF/YER057c/UK114 family)